MTSISDWRIHPRLPSERRRHQVGLARLSVSFHYGSCRLDVSDDFVLKVVDPDVMPDYVEVDARGLGFPPLDGREKGGFIGSLGFEDDVAAAVGALNGYGPVGVVAPQGGGDRKCGREFYEDLDLMVVQ